VLRKDSEFCYLLPNHKTTGQLFPSCELPSNVTVCHPITVCQMVTYLTVRQKISTIWQLSPNLPVTQSSQFIADDSKIWWRFRHLEWIEQTSEILSNLSELLNLFLHLFFVYLHTQCQNSYHHCCRIMFLTNFFHKW